MVSLSEYDLISCFPLALSENTNINPRLVFSQFNFFWETFEYLLIWSSGTSQDLANTVKQVDRRTEDIDTELVL